VRTFDCISLAEDGTHLFGLPRRIALARSYGNIRPRQHILRPSSRRTLARQWAFAAAAEILEAAGHRWAGGNKQRGGI